MAPVLVSTPAGAATLSAGPAEPVVDSEDIANLGDATGNDKWFAENSSAGAVKGQSFTTGGAAVRLKSITYQISESQKAEPTKTYAILAWVLGAADKNVNATPLLPTFDNTSDPDFFIFTCRRLDAANEDPDTSIAVEYGSNLSGWTAAEQGENIIITPSNDFHGGDPGIDKVEVKIRRNLGQADKLFVRLKVGVVQPRQ